MEMSLVRPAVIRGQLGLEPPEFLKRNTVHALFLCLFPSCVLFCAYKGGSINDYTTLTNRPVRIPHLSMRHEIRFKKYDKGSRLAEL